MQKLTQFAGSGRILRGHAARILMVIALLKRLGLWGCRTPACTKSRLGETLALLPSSGSGSAGNPRRAQQDGALARNQGALKSKSLAGCSLSVFFFFYLLSAAFSTDGYGTAAGNGISGEPGFLTESHGNGFHYVSSQPATSCSGALEKSKKGLIAALIRRRLILFFAGKQDQMT